MLCGARECNGLNNHHGRSSGSTLPLTVKLFKFEVGERERVLFQNSQRSYAINSLSSGLYTANTLPQTKKPFHHEYENTAQTGHPFFPCCEK